MRQRVISAHYVCVWLDDNRGYDNNGRAVNVKEITA